MNSNQARHGHNLNLMLRRDYSEQLTLPHARLHARIRLATLRIRQRLLRVPEQLRVSRGLNRLTRRCCLHWRWVPERIHEPARRGRGVRRARRAASRLLHLLLVVAGADRAIATARPEEVVRYGVAGNSAVVEVDVQVVEVGLGKSTVALVARRGLVVVALF